MRCVINLFTITLYLLPFQVSVSSSAVELDLAVDWLFDIDVPLTRTGKTELEQYLAEPIVAGVKDPLKWWYGKRDVWPKLSRMALDYHSIPCTF
jgi:hypothetical protein